MGALGVVIYARSIRAVDREWPPGMPLVWPYLIAGVLSCVSVSFFPGAVLPALREAAQESFVANIGLLILAFRRSRQAQPSPLPGILAHSGRWILFSTLATGLFFLFLGRGYMAAGDA
jgi:hypothetical protein